MDKEKLTPEEFRLKYKINFQDLPISKITIQGNIDRKILVDRFLKFTDRNFLSMCPENSL